MFLQTSSISTEEVSPSPTLTSSPRPGQDHSLSLSDETIEEALKRHRVTENRTRRVVAYLNLPPASSPGNKFFGPPSARIMQYTSALDSEWELKTPPAEIVSDEESGELSSQRDSQSEKAYASPRLRPIRTLIRGPSPHSRAQHGSRKGQRRSRSTFNSRSRIRSEMRSYDGELDIGSSLVERKETGNFEDIPWGVRGGLGRTPGWRRSAEDERGWSFGERIRKIQKVFETAWGGNLAKGAAEV